MYFLNVRIRHYLLDFTHFILRVRLTNQLYSSKSVGKLELLEFEIIDKINHYIIKILDKLKGSSDKTLEKAMYDNLTENNLA